MQHGRNSLGTFPYPKHNLWKLESVFCILVVTIWVHFCIQNIAKFSQYLCNAETSAELADVMLVSYELSAS